MRPPTLSNLVAMLGRLLVWAGGISSGPVLADEGTGQALERLTTLLEAQLVWSQALVVSALLALLVVIALLAFLLLRQSPTKMTAGAAAQEVPPPPASEAAERWEILLERIGQGLWTLNTASGELHGSTAWWHELGYAPEEIPRNLASWRALVHPEDQPKVRRAFENLLGGAGENLDIEYRLRTKTGVHRRVRTLARLIRDDTGRPRRMFGINGDITHQHEIEQRLARLTQASKEGETLFQRFFQNAEAAMLLIDPRDGRIVDANPAACGFYGYACDELLALSIGEINQATQEETGNELAEALSQGRERTIQRHRLKDGRLRSVEVSLSTVQRDERLLIYAIVHDITTWVEAERALREAAAVFEVTSEAIMITDAAGVIRRVNQAFTRMTGYSAAEAIGQTPRILKSDRHDEHFFETMWERLRQQGHWEGELWNRRKNGEVFPVWQIMSAVRDAAGSIVGYASLAIDITQKKRDEEEIAFRANYDSLTGLPNRNLLIERLDQALKQARREGSRVAVMFLDLDFFKEVNDTLGHAIGDRLLRLVAGRMRLCVRETDTIARLGGDEFVIVLTDISSSAPAATIAEKIIAQMNEPFDIEGNEIHIGVSIGITLFPDDGRDIDTLFRNADLAMYRAKAIGRNNAQFFEPTLTSAAIERRILENDLRGALSRREFRLHFLPLVDLTTNRITGAEALLRWQHPQRGLIEPAKFIPLAEDTGLIREIGAWAFDEACHQLAAWEATGSRLMLAINVSLRQLPEALSVQHILAVLGKYGLSPRQIVLEITERTLLAEMPAVQQWITAAGEAGLNLAIDDFGTGYSSLAYLKRFPVRHVKIDKSFVANIESDVGQRALVEAILAMAHSLGLSVVAEGVDALGQASLLRERHCELAQGYLYSQPLPAEEFSTLLKKPQP